MSDDRTESEPTIFIRLERDDQDDCAMYIGEEDFALIIYKGDRSITIDWDGNITAREREAVHPISETAA